MNLTIELSDDNAARLIKQAEAQGVTIERWLQMLTERQALTTTPAEQAGTRPIWEVITDRVNKLPVEVFDRVPTDGASEHDHYIYGSPKKNL